MKKHLLCISLLLILFSCNKKQEQVTEQAVAEPIIIDYGLRFNDFDVLQDTIRRGDTFGTILEKQNINNQSIPKLIQIIKDSIKIKNIKAGKTYTLFRTKDASKRLQYMVYQPDRINYYFIDFRDSVVAYNKTKPISFKRRTIAGKLNGSLSETLKNEGATAALSTKLISVYKWSIDFFKSKKGDQFAITYTERYINDTLFDGIEDLECSFFEYKGKKIYAFPFVQDTTSGKTDYYDQNGNALRNFFLKAPLKSIHITSKFSKSRFHPVQLRFKPHSGTDYAAPHGTPVMTTATGVVEQTGYTAGNGNFVKVKHDRIYATQYLHLSKILVRRGQSIKQGDIIGKVGSTGLATGPHVCYRFWKNGIQVDALKLKLPNSESMNPKNKPRFLASIMALQRELDSVATVK